MVAQRLKIQLEQLLQAYLSNSRISIAENKEIILIRQRSEEVTKSGSQSLLVYS
jgi:hypothetical protein